MEHNQTIGTILKKYRNKKKVELEEVAQKTKINMNILRALEDDDLKSLPNKTYVRGFVINYAKTIGLDANEAKAALENTYRIKFGHVIDETVPQNTLGSLQADNPQEDETEEIKETLISIVQGFLNKKIIYSIAALIILTMITKGVVNFFSELNFESRTITKTSTQMKQVTPTLKQASENLFDLKASKKIAAEIIAERNKKEVAAIAKPEKKEVAVKKIPILIKGKFPFKKFYPAPQNMYDIVTDSEEEKDASLLPPNIKAAMIEGKQNIYIIAIEADTWISFKVDDKKIKRYVLKKGRRTLIKGDRVLLFMGNFNATKIFLNNKLLSASTKSGVKSMIFPEDAAKEYELPLFPSFNGIPYSAEVYQTNMATESESSNQ